jgi:outer membrane protein OmpA-like peptidoglycan-associated protein
MKKRAEQQVQRRADQRADRAVDKAVDAAEGAVTCVVTDSACAETARKAGKPVVLTDAAGKPVQGPAAGAADRPGTGAWVNFDFTPGERPLFVDDFARDGVGDFPRRLEFVKGNMEVAEWNGARYLRATSWPSTVVIPLPETLPERFTVEMDVVPGRANNYMHVRFAEKPKHHVRVRYFSSGISGGLAAGAQSLAEGSSAKVKLGEVFPLRIMVDGRYAKVYAGDTRIANVPSAELGRSNRIEIELPGTDATPGFVGNVRVMAGGRDLYDALSESGRVATQGIYFDTGSDVLRPESSGTLREIARMLEAHADLRLTIEGHTDDVGDAAANRALSERRAAAVKAALVASYGVDAARLQTAGLGDTKPAAPNATPEGRQQNRRVELVRN